MKTYDNIDDLETSRNHVECGDVDRSFMRSFFNCELWVLVVMFHDCPMFVSMKTGVRVNWVHAYFTKGSTMGVNG